MPDAKRRLRARNRPGLHRLVLTMTAAGLAAGALAAVPPAARAAASCLVTNQATAATYASLQDAVTAAPAGAQLVVSGTCTGTTTISTNVTITGQAASFPRPAMATLNGAGQGTVLTIDAGTTVTIDNLAITGGSAPGTDGFGGGIDNAGSVTLTDAVVSGNTAANGGGIGNDGGIITLTGTVVSGNTAANGGGIFSQPDSTGPFPAVTLNGSTTVTDNATTGDGGGLYNEGTVTLNDTVTISRNTGQYGGGIYNGGTVTFTYRATVTDNTAQGFGGGIRNLGTLNNAYAGINVFGNTPDDID